MKKSDLAIAFVIGLIAISLVRCSSQPYTKWTAPEFRIMVDPESVDAANYVNIRQALWESGRFFVVDRQKGFSAVIREQNMEHGQASFERFNDRDRYARLAHLYGVGGIVVAHVTCVPARGMFQSQYIHCQQFLALVNANTAEVVAEVRGEDDSAQGWIGHDMTSSDWTDLVGKLNNAIPKNFAKDLTDPKLHKYQEVVKEESQRERESR